MGSKAMVVLSGGQDSTTCLFWAKQKFDEVHAVTFDYGQRHAREIEAAESVAKLARVATHEVIRVPAVLHGRSPLVSDEPLERYDNFEQMDKVIGDRIELTFVPMRNALFFTLAANRCSCMDIPNLVTGICMMDNANYPDCREAFRRAVESMVNYALGLDHGNFLIHAPLMFLSKAQSVELATTLPGCMAALAFSHTSYNGEYPPTDSNHANVLRAYGFEEAGMPDPLVVRAWDEGLMRLPDTPNYHKDCGALIADIDAARIMLRSGVEPHATIGGG